MPLREYRGEPHDLQVETGEPVGAGVEQRFDQLRISFQVELFPRTLKEQLVEVAPVYAGAAIRIFDADESCAWICSSQRARNADAGLRIGSAVKPTDTNFQLSPAGSVQTCTVS